MTNNDVFANRVKRIKKASGSKRRVKTKSTRRFGARLITPAMLVLCISGGMTVTWDAMERPTDTPLELAEDLTNQFLAYLNTI